MRPRANGFTLIETLVVLAIIAALGLAFIGSFDKGPTAVRGAAESVAGALAEARSLASATGEAVALQTSGTRSSLALTCGVAVFDGTGKLTGLQEKGPGGSFSFKSDVGQNLRYAAVDAGGAELALVSVTPGLASALKSANEQNTAAFKYAPSDETFDNPLFKADGSLRTEIFFTPNGRASQAFSVGVVGMAGGKLPSPRKPVAMVLVSREGIINRFFKPIADAPDSLWKRM